MKRDVEYGEREREKKRCRIQYRKKDVEYRERERERDLEYNRKKRCRIQKKRGRI